MRIGMGIAGALLALSAATAQAKSYDLDLTINNWDFDGSFDFSKSGNCTASSLLCPDGSKPDFTTVRVSDGFNQSFFTQASLTRTGHGEQVVLYDLNGMSGLSSQVIQLSFGVNNPLGGNGNSFKLSDIALAVNGNGTGLFSCGTRSVTCSASLKSGTVAAPEVDPASAGGMAALLLASLLVLGERRLRARLR